MGIKGLSIGFVMIALFTIAILGFAMQFATDNDAAVSIADDSDLVSLYNSGDSYMDDFANASEDTYSSILDTTVEPGSDVIQSAAPFAITPTSMLGTVNNILSVGFSKIFGNEFGIFLTTFYAMMVLIIGYFIVKLWKGGNPD